MSRSYLLSGPEYSQFTGTDLHQLRGILHLSRVAGAGGASFCRGLDVERRLYVVEGHGSSGPTERLPVAARVCDIHSGSPASFRCERYLGSPVWPRKRWLASPGVAEKIIGGWQLQGIYTAQSGPPLNFGNVLYTGDIKEITLPPGERTPEGWFNTAGFERASANQLSFNYRTFPSRLNNVRGDGVNNWDLSVLKNMRVREKVNLQFRGEFLNAFNHVNFAPPNTSPTSTAFGQVTSQSGYPRRIQLMLKVLF